LQKSGVGRALAKACGFAPPPHPSSLQSTFLPTPPSVVQLVEAGDDIIHFYDTMFFGD